MAKDRSLRVLALFTENESRDELGIGSVRDAIADNLFPGTSTIQTRLRYMLLLPWMYRELEKRKLSPTAFATEARKFELSMIEPLLNSKEKGVFGAQSKGELKRPPSSVYWSGLGKWGIRTFEGSQSDYFRSATSLTLKQTARRQKQDGDTDPNHASLTWDGGLPDAPDGFPGTKLDLKIRLDEGRYLRDRIVASAPKSLLAWLVLHGEPDSCAEPWHHHQLAEFPLAMRQLLEHGHLLSDVVEGAAWVYNICLADLRGDEGLGQRQRESLRQWRQRIDLAKIKAWNLDELWTSLASPNVSISTSTRTFLASWIEVLTQVSGNVADNDAARAMVEARERSLKKSRSRFLNRGALGQWGGNSGLNRLVFRWPTTSGFLADLLPALA